jgi:hypothetical protein
MFLTPVERVEFRIVNIVADGDTVLTERVDVFQLPNGVIELPVMGTFEVRAGKIAAWRDYFDLNQYMSQLQGAAEMSMQYRRLGPTGLQVSVLSFGSWVSFGDQIGIAEATDCLQAAHDAGVNFFDNAEAYAGGESERIMAPRSPSSAGNGTPT